MAPLRSRGVAVYRLIVQILMVAALLTLFATHTRGSDIAMDFTGNAGNLFDANSTFGWSFSVHRPIRVDRLGFFDDFVVGGAGLRQDHLVRLWKDDGSETLLTSAMITNGSAVEPSTADDGQWLFEPISPLVLPRGDYVIGADDPGCDSGTCDRIRYITNATTMPAISHGVVRNAGTPGFPTATTFNREDGYFGPTFWATPLPGPDFNLDDRISCQDVDALVAEIAAASHAAAFDMTGDGLVDGTDLTEWLAQAGAHNLGPGRAYLVGDANLDGGVDGQDFVIWNANKFTNTPAWCAGDFNASGVIDGQDFLLWNTHKFTSADGAVLTVPEPRWGGTLLLLGLSGLLGYGRRGFAGSRIRKNSDGVTG